MSLRDRSSDKDRGCEIGAACESQKEEALKEEALERKFQGQEYALGCHDCQVASQLQESTSHHESNQLPESHSEEDQEIVSREESDDFFDLYDTDGSGTVDMEELLEMVAAFKQIDSSKLNRAKIKQVWDADGDGMVRVLTVS